MSALLQFSINLSSPLSTPHDNSIQKQTIFGSNSSQPMNCYTLSRTKIDAFHIFGSKFAQPMNCCMLSSRKIGAFHIYGSKFSQPMNCCMLSSRNIGAFHIYGLKSSQSISCCSVSRVKVGASCRDRLKMGALRGKWSFLEVSRGKDGILVRGERWKSKKRVVLVRFNEGFGFNGGGGGRDNSNNARVLGNLVLAIILTYLTMSGQLGWVLDAVVSVWLFAVLAPIVGLGAFLWWAGRDIVQSSCPNCGNDFQVFKSTLNDEVQLCPFCSQPFSVVGDEFVRDPVRFSNQTTTFGQAFNDFSPPSATGKDSSVGVVDVEAEVRDAD